MKIQTASAAQRQKNQNFTKKLQFTLYKKKFLTKLQKYYTKLFTFAFTNKKNSQFIKNIQLSSLKKGFSDKFA